MKHQGVLHYTIHCCVCAVAVPDASKVVSSFSIAIVPHVLKRQIYYSSSNGRIFRLSYKLDVYLSSPPLVVTNEESIIARNGVNVSKVSFDPAHDILYWIESSNEGTKVSNILNSVN